MSWQHIRDETPTARKTHQCFLCGQNIDHGTRHVRRTGTQDKEFQAFRMHAECDAFTRKHWDAGDWESFSPGELDRPTT